MSTTHKNTMNSTDDNDIVANPHKRVGKLKPTAATAEKLANLTDFLVPTEPDVVGGTLDDTERVKECLGEAVEYYHDNLPDNVRDAIKEKWGLSDSMINARKIGYVDDTNGVVEHLLDSGFTETTIVRAGLASSSLLNHLFGCSGVSSENKHLVRDSRLDVEVDSSCRHTDVPESVDVLVRGQLQGHIKPEQIDIEAVLEHAKGATGLSLWNWWHHRIVFPYRNKNGEYTYLIGRATDKTDDRVYSNGVIDRTETPVTTIADTRLGGELPYDDDVLSDFVVLQYRNEIFKTPDEDDVEEAVSDFKNTFDDVVNGNGHPSTLEEFGVLYDDTASNTETKQISVVEFDEDDLGLHVDPAATGVKPGDTIEIVNYTDHEIEVDVATTPDDVWWDDKTFTDSATLECSERGNYRYRVVVDGEEYNGIVIAYDTVYTDSRNMAVEDWVRDEPGFELDIAKYVKQTIDRPWINHDAVNEPIFGIDTVHEGKPLLVTEGVTDALMAHQHGFPCIAPATTNLKKEHFDELPENISTVYNVNDNEVNNAGINGALRNAKVFENNGQTALVAELPRPDGQDKIDLAEFLQNHSRDDLMGVLEDAVPPEEHPLFDPQQHDPSYRRSQRNASEGTNSDNTTDREGSRTTELSDDALSSDSTSALYSLELEDVIDWEVVNATGASNSAGSVVYRGVNPIQHHGNSEGYFVIRDHGEYYTAKDFKISSTGNGYYYNPLTWLATEAPDTNRSVTNPAGSLSNEEVWKVWKYAKEADHIPVPEDDPVPLRAVWHIAEKHELYPPEMIPESFEDTDGEFPTRLTATPYNRALEIIKNEYGVEPGREHRTP